MQITDHAGGGAVYLPARDANGNITALIDAGATAPGANPVAASYEYSPFGELLRVEGPYAAANPFRFSSKFTDDETGLVCYGLRYYNPAFGRFLNRDPIGGAGGPNLYAFCGNNGVNRWDFLGLADPSVGMPEGGGGSGTWDNIINLGGFDSGWESYGNSRGTSLVDGSKHDSQNKDFPSIRRWLESRVTGGKTYADRVGSPNMVFVWEGQEFPLRHPVEILKSGQEMNRGDSVITDGHIFTILSPTDLSDELSDGRFVYVLNRDTGNVYGINPRAAPPNYPDKEQLDLQLGRAFFVASLMGKPNPAVLAARSGGTAAAVARVGAAEILPATLNPNRISFMQSSIKNQTGEFTVLGNAEALRAGTLKVADLSSIRVWADDAGKIWTLDHRRLGSFRLAEVGEVPVQWASPRTVQEGMWKMTTKTGGSSIRLKLGNSQNVIIK